jgi:hypothetical protein
MKLLRDNSDQLYAEFEYGRKLGFLEYNYHNNMNTITPQIFVAQKTEAPTLTVRTNALNTLAIIFAQ